MYYTFNRISKKVYDYCLKQKIADPLLIAKWKKPGYERLCSTYVINPSNYKFGTTSICRVPIKDRGENSKNAIDPTTGCMGCASGLGAGPRNIFGNKYGQNLAAVQIARENRMAAMEEKRRMKEQQQQEHEEEEDDNDEDNTEKEEDEEQKQSLEESNVNDDDAGESETDDETDDEDDYGPSPAAGVWAGSKKLQAESEAIEDHDEEEDEASSRPIKKQRL